MKDPITQFTFTPVASRWLAMDKIPSETVRNRREKYGTSRSVSETFNSAGDATRLGQRHYHPMENQVLLFASRDTGR
jgi:hypothetical protein